MARHVPARFHTKLSAVQDAVQAALAEDGRHFRLGAEAVPGVRLVAAEVDGRPVVLSLWTQAPDVVELCGDAAYPATGALLAIDEAQARSLRAQGVFVDLSQFTRSEAYPGTYYALVDHVSPKQVHGVLHRLIPQLEPHDDRTQVA
jgi:hypothetical protein